MKKTGKIFVSMASLGILLNNVAYATTDTAQKEGGLQIKYIFMGIAALVVVLLLYLGYKMDTKGSSSRPTSKQKKAKAKLEQKAEEIKHNDGVYEEDADITYEEDGAMDNDELNEVTEYSDDDEEEGSLYAAPATNENEESLFEESGEPTEENPEPAEPLNDTTEEDVGEEFDTSVIDKLDEDEPVEDNNLGKDSFDETMLFNSDDFNTADASFETGTDEIDTDNVEISSEPEEVKEPEEPAVEEITTEEPKEDVEINILDNTEDSFINELKNFEEPESDFEGFSSGKKTDKPDKKEEPVEETVKEPVETETVEEPKISFSTDDDFLSQMEANLQKNKADREAKKASKTSSSKETKSKTTKKTTK